MIDVFSFQILLKLARGIFEEQQSLERVVHKILIESKSLFKCEHICVFIVELPLEYEVDKASLSVSSDCTHRPERYGLSDYRRHGPMPIKYQK